MMAFFETTVITLGLIIVVCGLMKLTFVPLSLFFELRAAYRRGRDRWSLADANPLVSVIVPGYNEENVLENCVHSIMDSDYPSLEVILVDDGSTDSTPVIMQRLSSQYNAIRFIHQQNQGKGAALNTGIAHSRGEILMFVDSDGLFSRSTIRHMLSGFDSRSVGAVCGDDRPVNLDRVQTCLLALISHVGTGLVRRALTMLHCMPIVSGNVGAFRRDVLEKTGYFNTETVGEDLELTWRVHKHGYVVNFVPDALVYAESPSTIAGLWKQRVRWARGLLQTTWMHRGMVGNLRYGMFGFYLLFNTITMIFIPLFQLMLPLLILPLVFTNNNPLPSGVMQTLAWLGLITSIMLVVYSVILNRAYGDLRFAWALPLWPLYSTFMGFTMAKAVGLELRRAPNRWNKLERTGVISINSTSRQTRDITSGVARGGALPAHATSTHATPVLAATPGAQTHVSNAKVTEWDLATRN